MKANNSSTRTQFLAQLDEEGRTSIYLQEQFAALWQHFFGSKNNRWGTIYDFLWMMYQRPDRYYHNMNHILFGLKEIDAREKYFIKELRANVNLIRMAWWFHDVVYDPWRQDNEYRSMIMAKHILDANEIKSEILMDIMNIIFSTNYTKDMILGHVDTECYIIRDIDFLSMAADPKQFDINSENIDKEYLRHTSQEYYSKKRKEFLTKLYEKDFIYSTDYYQKHYNDKAKRNIERELKKITLSEEISNGIKN